MTPATATPATELVTLDLEKYLVHSRLEIVSVLREVIARRSLVTLTFERGRDSMVTSLLRVNPEVGDVLLDCSSSADANQRLLASQSLIATSFVDSVKIQFKAQRAESTTFEGKPALRLRLPESLLRLQRREHYRMLAPVAKPIKCLVPRLRDKAGKAIEFRIVDISCGGIGVTVTQAQPLLELGQELENCRIDLPEIGTVITGLVVRNVSETTDAAGGKGQRCGCQFVRPPASTVNMVQRYINMIERERRART